MLDAVFLQILNMGFTASFVIVAVLLLRLLLKKAPRRFSYLLWAVVLLRLVCPFTLESAASLIRINPTPLPSDIVTTDTPRVETGLPAVDAAVNEVLAELKFRIVGLERRIFAGIAANYAGKGDAVHFEDGLDSTAVRELADAIAESCGGRAAVFSGDEENGYAYCLVTREGDLRTFGKEMTKALNGRGGGKPGFQQGRVMAKKAEIESFFKK